MKLDFPEFAVDGTKYTDDCGNIWIYDGIKWTITSGPQDSPFQRLASGDIVPKVPGDNLSMIGPEGEQQDGVIELQDYPEI